ncbi:MAG: hypothetical protein JNM25_17125 [Planctomycetes bacterium]|nr:hypothetical protein [Planctomycetota bacterium]
MNLIKIMTCGVACALAASLSAQVPPIFPFVRTADLLVLDSDSDGVLRLSDSNQDGDYNDPGEITTYYDPAIAAVAMTNPNGITCSNEGIVYTTDVSTDTVYWMRDSNLDGDANDPGESGVFFDASNVGGLVMQIPYSLVVDRLGRVFVAVTNQSMPPTPDRILMLQDLTNNGNANDMGEATDYYTIPGSTPPSSLAVSIPTKVAIGPDNNLYYTDVGTSTGQRGVWRLVDGNMDGDCNDPGEASLFWNPGAGAAQYWALAFDALGYCYVTDHSNNEQVWRGRDANTSGDIDPSEQTLFYQTSGSSWWDIVMRDDGTVLLCDTQPAASFDRITALRDTTPDGDALDLGESFEAYDASVSPTTTLVPRGAVLWRGPLLQLVPDTLPIGQTMQFVVTASRPGDATAVFLTPGLAAPVPLPPYGVLEVDIGFVVQVDVGAADATATYTITLPWPNDPVLIGDYGIQAISGDLVRLLLSNAVLLTIT